MSTKEDITGKIKVALRISCDEALYFSGDEAQIIEAEYLITINAAKCIKELNQSLGYPYRIRIEHCTEAFGTACTPLLGKQPADNILGHTIVARTKNDTDRPGRIDLAVYKETNGDDAPVCAIEFKGFNPTKERILDDLKRNAEYFSMASPSGSSVIQFTAFAALHRYVGVWNQDKECKNIEKVRGNYEKYINESSDLSHLSHEIDVFTLRHGTAPSVDDPYVLEHGLQGDEDYHYVGVVVVATRI